MHSDRYPSGAKKWRDHRWRHLEMSSGSRSMGFLFAMRLVALVNHRNSPLLRRRLDGRRQRPDVIHYFPFYMVYQVPLYVIMLIFLEVREMLWFVLVEILASNAALWAYTVPRGGGKPSFGLASSKRPCQALHRWTRSGGYGICAVGQT